MTEPDYDLENDDSDDTSEGGYGRVPRAQIRKWEKTQRAHDEALERAAKAERRAALVEAGLHTLTERQQKALLADIDGDITAETLRANAVELGFVQPAPDSAPDVERQQMEQMSQASAGAADPGGEDAIARLDRAEREGGYEGLLAELRSNGSLAG